MPAAAPVFGDVNSQTNGALTTNTPSQDTPRPFGFGFGGAKTETQSPQDQNLFFQCMTQNPGPTPSLSAAQAQSKDTNYFTVVSESLSKEPPSLFKSVTSSENQKKTVGAAAPAGLFGSAPATLTSHKEQPKVPETHPTGNGVLNKPSPAFQGMGGSGVLRGSSLSMGGMVSASGAQGAGNRSGNNGTSAGGLGLQTGFNTSDSHQNLFLQASKEPSNPFLAYGDKTPHTSFAGLSGAEPQTLGTASDSKPNLFTMAEPPKGILPSPFTALSTANSSSSSSSPTPALSQRSQNEGAVSKEEQEVGDKPSSTSGGPLFESTAPGEMEEVSFDQSQTQKFSLEERCHSSKRDSDSSSNSDLSDLSENEDGLEKGQTPGGPPHSSKDVAMLQKSKVPGAAKGRPRNKPFKGKPVMQSVSYSVIIIWDDIQVEQRK